MEEIEAATAIMDVAGGSADAFVDVAVGLANKSKHRLVEIAAATVELGVAVG